MKPLDQVINRDPKHLGLGILQKLCRTCKRTLLALRNSKRHRNLTPRVIFGRVERVMFERVMFELASFIFNKFTCNVLTCHVNDGNTESRKRQT